MIPTQKEVEAGKIYEFKASPVYKSEFQDSRD